MLSSRPPTSSFGRRAVDSLSHSTMCLPLAVSAVPLNPGSSRRAATVASNGFLWMACAYIAPLLSWCRRQHPARRRRDLWGQHVTGGTANPQVERAPEARLVVQGGDHLLVDDAVHRRALLRRGAALDHLCGHVVSPDARAFPGESPD